MPGKHDPAEPNDFAAPDAGGRKASSGPGETSGRNSKDPTQVTAGAVLGYSRVSTTGQNLDRQLDALRQAGCTRIFEDHGISGSEASRPGLDSLLEYARPGDEIVVQSLDRLGRKTTSLLTLVELLTEKAIGLRILNLGIDTRTPSGQLVLTLMSALSQMERDVLRERVISGLEAARKRGRVGGRPPALSDERKEEVVRMRAEGRAVAEIARIMVTSDRTVRRILAAVQPHQG